MRLSSLEKFEHSKFRTENWLGRHLEPSLQYTRIDLPEINGHLEITVHQIGKAGSLPYEARLDRVAGEDQRRSRSVIGSQRTVFLYAPAELAERHQQHTIG